jgi:predicted ester cyclase
LRRRVGLKQAIAPEFIDRTLPPGRPQGPQGPAFASHQFRAAVPDLGVEVKKMIVAGDYVTVHMVFTGHFTGTFGQAQGKGQSINFIATDLLKITDGRITDRSKRSKRRFAIPNGILCACSRGSRGHDRCLAFHKTDARVSGLRSSSHGQGSCEALPRTHRR